MSSPESGHRERLKAKFLSSGFAGLHDYEQLELLLTFAIPRQDVKPVAKALLKQFKSLPGILDAPHSELVKVSGIGANAATLLKVVKETCCEYLSANMQGDQVTLSTPCSVKDFARMKLGGSKNEAFMVIYLNTQNRVIDHEIEFVGTVNKTIVYPRNIIKNALLKDATGLIVVHNHPSGTPTPSKHDLELTQSLKEAAQTVNIRLLDHLIVTQSSTLSFVEKNLL